MELSTNWLFHFPGEAKKALNWYIFFRSFDLSNIAPPEIFALPTQSVLIRSQGQSHRARYFHLKECSCSVLQ